MITQNLLRPAALATILRFALPSVLALTLFLGLLLNPQRTQAAILFGIVSERAAPTVVVAAEQLLLREPGHTLILRTPAQIMATDSPTLKRWLGEADAVFTVAVFAEHAQRIQAHLDLLPQPPKQFIAIQGDPALSLRSHFNQIAITDFAEAAALTRLQDTLSATVRQAAATHVTAARWLALHDLWRAGGMENIVSFMQALLVPTAVVPTAKLERPIRLRLDGQVLDDATNTLPSGAALVVLDLNNSDPQPADAICAESRLRDLGCVVIMAKWGAASKEAVEKLAALVAPAKPVGLVVLQDFVVGSAEGRDSVAKQFEQLNIPVLKAIRLTDRSATAWRLSEEGLPIGSVQYRLAMPELQGISQPAVIAAAGKPSLHQRTGLELRRPEILPDEVASLVNHILHWRTLQNKANADKKLALIYYNHPPGRQNIGADNLDVPATLFDILKALKQAGYTTGDLPASPAALLDLMQERGVNLPEDRAALDAMAQKVDWLSSKAYASWFNTLPDTLKHEMIEGPLGRLHTEMVIAQQAGEPEMARQRLRKSIKELRHFLEGVAHPKRQEALSLLEQLQSDYVACLDGHGDCQRQASLKARLSALNIEGLRGWGEAPGKVMVSQHKQLLPGIHFGNIFIGPQPPRGWEVDEELLHANTTIPPPHQYLGFYHWLKDIFKADALIHVGRHSTYEFLPGKTTGLARDDYSRLIAGDVPGIYPYIVDGVGEGTQAKRRGLAVIVDHLTPPLGTTPLYDRLLELRQVVESYEASSSENLRIEAVKTMRRLVESLSLRAELEASMRDVLQVRGIGFEQADGDLLAHEIGHYLTKLQEKFMPHGLHIFGRPWSDASLSLMLDSMQRGNASGITPQIREHLSNSPKQEMHALLRVLKGGFVASGKGNDPLRSPESLPTGRNFHALDGDVLPTKLGFHIGHILADKVRQRDGVKNSEGVILWASDAVRDEGVMVGFILSLMGISPEWNARGIVQKMALMPNTARHDVIVTTSGLFRDLYPNLMQWIDTGGRLALAASAHPIARQYPELQAALAAALAPLTNNTRGDEAIANNGVAEHWLRRVKALMATGLSGKQAGKEAAWRIFGTAPGDFSAGVNRLTERSGSWQKRQELGQAYLRRMGHAYALDAQGEPAHKMLSVALEGIANTYHGRASNLYGLMDNNDAFDYLGGLSLATEVVTGHRPQARILNHANPAQLSDDPLETALLMEMRGRYLNPAWIKPLMAHGYAGARTMGQEFMENLWGWQVTRPDIIKDWAWEEVKRVYIDDSLGLGLNQFLAQGHNAQVKAHMLAIMLVAAEKGFWHTDPATLKQLSTQLARQVNKNGLPGSGHTAPNHPLWRWMGQYLNAADRAALQQTLAKANGKPVGSPADKPRAAPSLPPDTPMPQQAAPTRAYELEVPKASRGKPWLWGLLPLFLAGMWRGSRKAHS